MREITGYLPEDFYSDPDLLDRIVHPDDLHLLEAMEAGTDVDGSPVVLRLIRKDGTITWTENRSVPVFDERRRVDRS